MLENWKGKILEGRAEGTPGVFYIIVSRFNEFITNRLLEGALNCLTEHGVQAEQIVIIRVPGSFEIPGVAQRVAMQIKPAAIICLGAVIKGETPHFDYVACETSHGIAEVSRLTGIPTIFGILTTDNLEQALARVEGSNNRGRTAALVALEMSNLIKHF